MLNRDFKEFAELLHARGVEYLVVGGYALAAHGHPRYTGDIDFWVRPTPENRARLLVFLNDFGFGSLGLRVDDFKTNKRASGRLKDLADLESLEPPIDPDAGTPRSDPSK